MTTTSTEAKRINVTTTAYEGANFPEAAHYPEFVAEQLALQYEGVEINCSEGGLSNQVFVYGFGERESDVEHDVLSQVKVELWDQFCDWGYKAYSIAPARIAEIIAEEKMDAEHAGDSMSLVVDVDGQLRDDGHAEAADLSSEDAFRAQVRAWRESLDQDRDLDRQMQAE